MPLSTQNLRAVREAALKLPLDAPELRVEDFIAQELALNAAQKTDLFPDPDPAGHLAIAVAELTELREMTLTRNTSIPPFAVYKDVHANHCIAGLNTYLSNNGNPALLLNRLKQHQQLRSALLRFKQGHDLEALAAAIMHEAFDYGQATQGSGDQGIDAIGWKRLKIADPAFSNGSVDTYDSHPGEKVFYLASSKAVVGVTGPRQTLINPAHIRELVGGWLIQRTDAGKWQTIGIRMLSPVQMVLVTTYRLSLDAKATCRNLGIQVWGIPELIHLICSYAPVSVFDAKNNYSFSSKDFRNWWRFHEKNRLVAST